MSAVVWLVIDEAGHPIHCASYAEACHEHINDAINDFHVEGAEKWKVRSATLDAQSLLRPAISAANPLPPGCHCKPGQCMAPRIMGRQTPCRDPEKRATCTAAQSSTDQQG